VTRAVTAYVLVHGALHGGWCWERMVPHLEAAGHRVDALDLPGHGPDVTPIAAVSLADNARCIEHRVLAADEPVVLVGHSLGGISITQAAEALPGRIKALVYVAALVPADGQTMADLPRREPNDPVDGYAIVNRAAGTFTFDRAAAREVFYGECRADDAAWACSRLEPESLAAVEGRVDLATRAAAAVPRVYVECLRDRTITIARQRAIYSPHGFSHVLSIDTDHAPFLSRPAELAGHLLRLA
jgi:pimeloyl-ACP methyl ester carboxylesterase